MDAVLYVHGKNGSAAESEHYKPFFPDSEVVGLDYRTFTPWETGNEIREAAEELKKRYGKITLIANSIGAFFSMCSGIDTQIQKAFFISPVVDMEKLICDMMIWANVTEKQLQEQGIIHTAFGEDLPWNYLCWVRDHPVHWDVPTEILYGDHDMLTSFETVSNFADRINAKLAVMENGEHWFHTEEQMHFLDDWLRNALFVTDPLNEPDIDSEQTIKGCEQLILLRPSDKYAGQVMAFKEEMKKSGDSFDGCAGLEDCDSFEEWNRFDERLKARYKEGYVPSEVCLAVREKDDCLVGIIDYRHPLTDFLLHFGGNIGYSVRPSERHKGYGSEMLRLMLDICRSQGEKRVLLTCDRENTASQRIIRKNGGKLEDEIEDTAGLSKSGRILRFWISME